MASGGGRFQLTQPSADRRAASASGGERGERRLVGGGPRRRTGDSRGRAGVERLEERQELAAHPVPGEAAIDVGRVQPVVDSLCVERLPQVGAAHREERPHDPGATRRDPRQASRAAATRQVEEQRLGLVVEGVRRHGLRVGPGRVEELVEERIAGHAAGLLEAVAALTGEGGDIGPANADRDSQASGEAGHELRVGPGARSQGVIEVRDPQAPARHAGCSMGKVQERDGVGTTGDGQDDGNPIGGAEVARGRDEPVQQVVQRGPPRSRRRGAPGGACG